MSSRSSPRPTFHNCRPMASVEPNSELCGQPAGSLDLEELTDDDQLVYVNNVIKGKLLESQELVVQASNNTKAQFAASPTLSKEILNAIMDALAAHSTMANRALDSEKVRDGIKDVLLGPAQLYEALRDKADSQGMEGK